MKFYRIKIETDNTGFTTFMPQVKLSIFGKWYGIVTNNINYRDDDLKNIKNLTYMDGGFHLKSEYEALKFIEIFKIEIKRNNKIKYRYI